MTHRANNSSRRPDHPFFVQVKLSHQISQRAGGPIKAKVPANCAFGRVIGQLQPYTLRRRTTTRMIMPNSRRYNSNLRNLMTSTRGHSTRGRMRIIRTRTSRQRSNRSHRLTLTTRTFTIIRRMLRTRPMISRSKHSGQGHNTRRGIRIRRLSRHGRRTPISTGKSGARSNGLRRLLNVELYRHLTRMVASGTLVGQTRSALRLLRKGHGIFTGGCVGSPGFRRLVHGH